MRCSSFTNLSLEWNSTCFRQSLCPSSGVQHCTHSNRYLSYRFGDSLLAGSARNVLILLASCQHNLYVLLCVQCWTPDDGQRDCLKHVEFHSKNKFLKLVHLIGFVIRMYHDARPSECQIQQYIYLLLYFILMTCFGQLSIIRSALQNLE